MCEAIYAGNTEKTSKETIDVHFYYFQWKKLDSLSDNYDKHFKPIMSHTDLRKCMMFKIFKYVNTIVSVK